MSEAYRKAGVDIAAADRSVARMKRHVESTRRPEVWGAFGGFGGGFALDMARYKEPVLVSGTDGVGTKLLVARAVGRYDTVGIDCVAMCVNDIIVHGAEPLFFLDYLAVGRVDPDQVEAVVSGVAAGCREAGCALIGGETAEMPGMYAPGDYDLAGFAVGAVERARFVDGSRVRPGDVVIGLASAGLHSNGFSLARKIVFEDAGLSVEDELPECGATVGEVLLAPTRIYVRAILALLERVDVRGMAHITGGGLLDNVIRTLPEGCRAVLDATAWEEPPVFAALRRLSVEPPTAEDLYQTWNMGIGFVCMIAQEDVDRAMAVLKENGGRPVQIGRVEAGDRSVVIRTPHAASGVVMRRAETGVAVDKSDEASGGGPGGAHRPEGGGGV
ncbi:phosphoribosylformylglycinamidine cyclo-ligase [Kyrpidia spormannii]|uniref:Phosphoribosylaminoimidazole synthetase n=2 Tax=Kyrpidia spormannii TaxID=2055160 RepID=A0ACA8Z516_9BACL|nr:phosphoribosylformylglycinamidine cyclo-ligase [Kyrpidia spormannii]CAB3389487.1 phosphoribosylaminoimidazole synthetase [Kyrpidia spormannii]CAB3390260.1 phosphoribosylaminoimidazole synthetase [Kyrpidia spormannii]